MDTRAQRVINLGLAGLILLTGLPAVAAVAPSTAPVTANQVLQHLRELDNRKLTPVQKARLGLRLYRDEMVHPTPRPQAKEGRPAADPVTHDLVLARVTEKLAAVGADAAYLKKAWTRAHPGEVRGSLAVFLALRGDPAAKEEVSALVADLHQPLRLRALGATALGALAVRNDDGSLGAVLAKAIRQDAAGIYRPAPRGKSGYVLAYPVRRAAAAAIRKMEKAGLLLESFVVQAAEEAQTEVAVEPRSGK